MPSTLATKRQIRQWRF